MISRTNRLLYAMLALPPVIVLLVVLTGWVYTIPFAVWFLLLSLYYTVISLWKPHRGISSSHDERLVRLLQLMHEGRTAIEEYYYRRIRSELDGDIKLFLVLAKLHIENLEKKDQAIIAGLNQSIDSIIMAYEKVNSLSLSLHADTLKNLGLVMGLEEERIRLQNAHSLKTTYEIEGVETDIAPDKEVMIFRIAREWFRLIVNYAKASQIDLRLIYNADNMTIIIRDDGQWLKEKHDYDASIAIIRIMTEIYFGKWEVLQKDGWTSFEFSIPFKNFPF